MAAVRPACKWCGFGLWVLEGPGYLIRLCRRCDSAPATNPGNRLWATAPNAGGRNHPFFVPPAEWST